MKKSKEGFLDGGPSGSQSYRLIRAMGSWDERDTKSPINPF